MDESKARQKPDELGMWEWRKFVKTRGPAKIFGPETWRLRTENTGLREWLAQFWPWFRRQER